MSETIYIVSREKLIEFIENYLPEDALFELPVLYEILHRFVTPVGDEVVPLIDGNMNKLLTEATNKMRENLKDFE